MTLWGKTKQDLSDPFQSLKKILLLAGDYENLDFLTTGDLIF